MRAVLMGMIGMFVLGCAIPEEPPAQVPGAVVRFTPRDRQLIHDYYRNYPFPPGIANPSLLAPELQNRLEITAKVPPDLAGEPLPQALMEKLSSLPPGYVRFRAGSAVILMDVRTREVMDQVQIAFRQQG